MDINIDFISNYFINQDCRNCAFSKCDDVGGGDYEEIEWKCTKYNTVLNYVSKDKKPCGLSNGKNYKATYSINDNNS
jgi:hypothetical protein